MGWQGTTSFYLYLEGLGLHSQFRASGKNTELIGNYDFISQEPKNLKHHLLHSSAIHKVGNKKHIKLSTKMSPSHLMCPVVPQDKALSSGILLWPILSSFPKDPQHSSHHPRVPSP